MVRPAERPPRIEDMKVLTAAILRMTRKPPGNALLIGVSGVDVDANAQAGVALKSALEEVGLRVARIRDTGWHNLPEKRFNLAWPAKHYYENALRLDEMFDEVVMPLVFERNLHVQCRHVDETSATFRPQRYDFEHVDVVLVESLFLFKRPRRPLFDLKLWVDCTFEQALDRAMERSTEPAERTVRAYETIFFPAQRIHLKRDEPQLHADVIYADKHVRAKTNGHTTLTNRHDASPRSRRESSGNRLRNSDHRRWDEALIRLPL